METRRKRTVMIVGIVVAALIAVTGGGTTLFLVKRSHQRSDDVAAADRVAASFNKRVADYRTDVKSAVENADRSAADFMLVDVVSAVDAAPKLGKAPAWGRAHSKAYLKARSAEKSLKKPYHQLISVLTEAIVGQPFIEAGLEALSVNVHDFITQRLLPNGSRVRSEAIPGFRKALKHFNKVKVPHGQASVAAKIRSELQETIGEAQQVANSLDLGHGGLIFAKKEYISASKALLAYDKSLRKRVAAAANTVTGDVSDDQSAT